MKRFVSVGLVLGMAQSAAAHPGHGIGGGSEAWLHYLSEPLHVAPLVLAALALALVRVQRRRAARARTR